MIVAIGLIIALIFPNLTEITRETHVCNSERLFGIKQIELFTMPIQFRPSLRWCVFIGLIAACGIISLQTTSEFLYFQFLGEMNHSRFLKFLFVSYIARSSDDGIYFEPGGIFRKGYEQGMVEIISSGKNVANVENYNERIFEKYLISQYPEKVDTAVIGSSRIMQIGDSILNKNATILNNGVSGATVEDEIAIIWMYYNRGYLPNQIIIGIDPWIFNKNNEQTRWESIKDEYFHGMEMLGLQTKNESLFRIF